MASGFISIFDGTDTTTDSFDINVTPSAEKVADSTQTTVDQGQEQTIPVVTDTETKQTAALTFKRDPDALRTTLAVARARLRRQLVEAEWRDD